MDQIVNIIVASVSGYCQCNLEVDQIKEPSLACNEEDPAVVVFQAVMQGTLDVTASEIVAYAQQWVSGGQSVVVQGDSLSVIASCDVEVESFSSQCSFTSTTAYPSPTAMSTTTYPSLTLTSYNPSPTPDSTISSTTADSLVSTPESTSTVKPTTPDSESDTNAILFMIGAVIVIAIIVIAITVVIIALVVTCTKRKNTSLPLS